MKKDNHCSSLGQVNSPLFLMIFLIFAIFFFHSPLLAQKKQTNPTVAQISKESQIVEDLLHIYLTPPQMRDSFERIQIEGQSLKIYYLDPNQSQQALKLCTAMRWLINGRLKQSSGISKVFEQLPQIPKIKKSNQHLRSKSPKIKSGILNKPDSNKPCKMINNASTKLMFS
jgi:hypothetical protein